MTNRPTATAALLCLLLAPTGCVSPPSRVDQQAEARVSRDPAALVRIGSIAAASGDDTTATAFYGRAARLDPGDATAVLGYARGLAQQGQTDEAIVALRAALPKANNTAQIQIATALGRLLILAHQPAEAVSVFRLELGHAPEAVSLLIGLGVALDANREFSAAETSYGRALAIQPSNIAARNNLALSIALDGRHDQALELLRALRSEVAEHGGRDQDLATVDGNLALVYAMKGDLHQAAEAGAATTSGSADLAENLRFYAALRPYGLGKGDGDNNGLPPASAAAPESD